MNINDLEIDVRSTNCLKAAGITTVEQLCELSMGQILKLPNFGKKSAEKLLVVLERRGLLLADKAKSKTCDVEVILGRIRRIQSAMTTLQAELIEFKQEMQVRAGTAPPP